MPVMVLTVPTAFENGPAKEAIPFLALSVPMKRSKHGEKWPFAVSQLSAWKPRKWAPCALCLITAGKWRALFRLMAFEMELSAIPSALFQVAGADKAIDHAAIAPQPMHRIVSGELHQQ